MMLEAGWVAGFYIYIYIYIFFFFLIYLLTVLGLHCCTRVFSSFGEWDLLCHCSVQASYCGGFFCCKAQALENGLSSCGTWALLLHSMWDCPRPGMEPMSPARQGRFLTTGSPGKPLAGFLTEESRAWQMARVLAGTGGF